MKSNPVESGWFDIFKEDGSFVSGFGLAVTFLFHFASENTNISKPVFNAMVNSVGHFDQNAVFTTDVVSKNIAYVENIASIENIAYIAIFFFLIKTFCHGYR